MTDPQASTSSSKSLQDRSWRAAGSLRSGFGRQVTSTQPSSPGVGFGTSVRDSYNKTYVDASVDRALLKAQGGNNSQGSIYRVQETLGRQFVSTMRSASLPSFGRAERQGLALRTGVPGPGTYRLASSYGAQQESTKVTPARVRFPLATRDAVEKTFISVEHEKSGYGRDSPGPSAYNVSGGLGKQLLSSRESLPVWSMGSAPRRALGSSSNLPGAGQYQVPPAIGKQVTSTKKSSPSVGFCRGSRGASRKQFISIDHEKSNFGVNSPGPGTANSEAAVGRRLLSTSTASPAWGFGMGMRLRDAQNENPGPGEYYA